MQKLKIGTPKLQNFSNPFSLPRICYREQFHIYLPSQPSLSISQIDVRDRTIIIRIIIGTITDKSLSKPLSHQPIFRETSSFSSRRVRAIDSVVWCRVGDEEEIVGGLRPVAVGGGDDFGVAVDAAEFGLH